MRYFTLLTKDGIDERWGAAFGDYSRANVEYERDDYRDHGWRRGELKIITTNDEQAEIDAAVTKLNGE